jgi:hypothetical protein
MSQVLDPALASPPPVPAAGRNRRPIIVAAIAALVVGLLVGGLVGWALRGDSGTDAPAAVTGADGAALTERQREMVDMHSRLVAAMQANDGSAAAALFSSTGVLDFVKSNQELRVADGSLQEMVDAGVNCYVDAANGFTIHAPMVVDSDLVVATGVNAGAPFVAVTEFTPFGPVQIERHEISW